MSKGIKGGPLVLRKLQHRFRPMEIQDQIYREWGAGWKTNKHATWKSRQIQHRTKSTSNSSGCDDWNRRLTHKNPYYHQHKKPSVALKPVPTHRTDGLCIHHDLDHLGPTYLWSIRSAWQTDLWPILSAWSRSMLPGGSRMVSPWSSSRFLGWICTTQIMHDIP